MDVWTTVYSMHHGWSMASWHRKLTIKSQLVLSRWGALCHLAQYSYVLSLHFQCDTGWGVDLPWIRPIILLLIRLSNNAKYLGSTLRLYSQQLWNSLAPALVVALSQFPRPHPHPDHFRSRTNSHKMQTHCVFWNNVNFFFQFFL